MPTSPDLETIQRRIQAGKIAYPPYQPFLDFWEKILLVQSRYISRALTDPLPALDPLTPLKLHEGFPMFSFKEFRVETDRMQDLFREILQNIGTANPKMERQLPLIEKWLQTEGLDFQPWLDRLFEGDGGPFVLAAENSGLDPETLLFLFLASWKPFLKARALSLTERDDTDWKSWDRGYCPICGGMPLLAYLREGGRRHGVCSLCEFAWDLPRLLCPHCETRDQGKLRYFYTENEKGFRVEVCEACGHYLKTVDLREREGAPVAVVDDLLTTHLDLWAQKKGYHRLPFSGRII